MSDKTKLPKELQTTLAQSTQAMVRINLVAKPTDCSPNTQSKIGGLGYLPVDATYPVNDDNQPLALLAQLNFAELANAVAIDKLPRSLPSSGILQIYIDNQDDVWGCHFPSTPRDKYQVRFWQNTDVPMNTEALTVTQTWLRNNSKNCAMPFEMDQEYLMQFTMATQAVNVNCVEFEQFADGNECIWTYLEALGFDDEQIDAIADMYIADTYVGETHNGGHQILGYPNFTQDDPRGYNEINEHILLLQIDSDDDNDIMWGDCGIANFFIHPDDLAKQDFSQLVYNWDCC